MINEGGIRAAIKVQHQAKGGHCRGEAFCRGGKYRSMGTAVGGAASGIIHWME